MPNFCRIREISILGLLASIALCPLELVAHEPSITHVQVVSESAQGMTLAATVDYSNLTYPEGRYIEEASLTFELTSPPEEVIQFELFAITTQWDAQSLVQSEVPTTEVLPRSFWDIAPPQGDCVECKTIKLDLRSLFQDWVNQELENSGLLLTVTGGNIPELPELMKGAVLVVKSGLPVEASLTEQE
jgi:hypothetical protein